MSRIAGNVWFGGNPPLGVVLDIERAANGDVTGGKIQGLSHDQLASFGVCAERKLDVDGVTYEVVVGEDGTFMATRRIQ